MEYQLVNARKKEVSGQRLVRAEVVDRCTDNPPVSQKTDAPRK